MDRYFRKPKILTGKILRIFFMDQGCQVASVIKDHVQGFTALEAGKSLLDAPRIFFLGFTFPGEDRNTSRGNTTFNLIHWNLSGTTRNLRSCSMILGRENILKEIVSAIRWKRYVWNITQEDQVTSAPRAVRVSIKTAVWIVLQTHQTRKKQ